jgi:MFS family permease
MDSKSTVEKGGLGRTLRNRNFRLLLLGSLSSAVGYSAGTIVFQWYIYNATHSPLAIGAFAIVEFLPTLAFGLFAGVLADRFNRQRIMVSADLCRTAALAALAVFVWLAGLNVVLILLVVGVVASFTALFRPASQALLPTIVPDRSLADANGLLQSGGTTSSLIGYSLGGTLVAVAGLVAALALDSASFAISAILLLALTLPSVSRAPTPTTKGTKRQGSGLLEGFRYIRKQDALFLMMLTAGVGSFLFPIWETYLVVYVASGLHLGPLYLGVLLGVLALCAGLGALACGRLPTQERPGVWAATSWGVSGVGIAALALLPPFTIALMLVGMSTFIGQLGYTAWLTCVQRTTPNNLLGRVLSTETTVSWALFPVAQVLGAILLSNIGIPMTYLLVGVDSAFGGFVLLASKSVWNWGRTDN